jgi:hypothetical protein
MEGALDRFLAFEPDSGQIGHALDVPGLAADVLEVMRARPPLRCVQATAAAATARFRLWTEPAESDYEGALDFKTCAAAFHGTRHASGRVLQTVSLPDATFLREPGQPEWMRLHSSRWRQGSWDPFGVLDVVVAVPELVATEPEPTQRGSLQHHVGRLDAAAVERLADDASTVIRRVRPLPPTGEQGEAEISVWLDSRLRIHRVRYRTSRPRAALLHFELFDFARAVRVEIPERFESVDLDVVRGALRADA